MTKHCRQIDVPRPTAATPVETTGDETAERDALAADAGEPKFVEDRFEKYRIRFALEII